MFYIIQVGASKIRSRKQSDLSATEEGSLSIFSSCHGTFRLKEKRFGVTRTLHALSHPHVTTRGRRPHAAQLSVLSQETPR
jgi:hypothetical protein